MTLTEQQGNEALMIFVAELHEEYDQGNELPESEIYFINTDYWINEKWTFNTPLRVQQLWFDTATVLKTRRLGVPISEETACSMVNGLYIEAVDALEAEISAEQEPTFRIDWRKEGF